MIHRPSASPNTEGGVGGASRERFQASMKKRPHRSQNRCERLVGTMLVTGVCWSLSRSSDLAFALRRKSLRLRE